MQKSEIFLFIFGITLLTVSLPFYDVISYPIMTSVPKSPCLCMASMKKTAFSIWDVIWERILLFFDVNSYSLIFTDETFLVSLTACSCTKICSLRSQFLLWAQFQLEGKITAVINHPKKSSRNTLADDAAFSSVRMTEVECVLQESVAIVSLTCVFSDYGGVNATLNGAR